LFRALDVRGLGKSIAGVRTHAIVPAMRVLVIGPGYVGLSLGAELVRRGHEVFGLRRRGDADRALTSVGMRPLTGDISEPQSLAALPPEYDWVVNCAASTGADVENYRRVYLAGTRNLVAWLSNAPLIRYVYTSSTGVYGQSDGSMVDETAVVEPQSETGQVLASTERILLSATFNSGFPAVVLRVAGIYGPGRGWWLQQFLRGEACLEGEGRRILNMIHRDDVIGCIIAALEEGRVGEIYNAVDDEPVTQWDLLAWLAATLNKTMPPMVPVDEAALRRRGVASKRISNQKLKSELGYQFKFRTFREGFSHELQRMERDSL
jgi:nucleoside-diphosphate-sugar epimerase